MTTALKALAILLCLTAIILAVVFVRTFEAGDPGVTGIFSSLAAFAAALVTKAWWNARSAKLGVAAKGGANAPGTNERQ